MNSLSELLDAVRGIDPNKLLGLRPPYPPVAIEIDQNEMIMVRLKKRRRGKPMLEGHGSREIEGAEGAGTMLRPNLAYCGEVGRKLPSLYETIGARPGRVSLILPDNLAKVTLLSLPERPASRRHLEELVRFKVRRSVPFRIEEAALSYQMLPGDGRGAHLLVSIVRRVIVEQYERALESGGARVGLIDVCTPNLINLCHDQLQAAGAGGEDVALLNATQGYFTFVILRGARMIFFRCKSYHVGNDGDPAAPNGQLGRELAVSLSYYQEKLDGKRLDSVFVRSVAQPFDEIAESVRAHGIEHVLPVDPAESLEMLEGMRLDERVAQRIAPAVGAAAARG